MSLHTARHRIQAEITRAEHELDQLLTPPRAPAHTAGPAHVPATDRTRNGRPLLRDQVLRLLHEHPDRDFSSHDIRRELGCLKNTLTQAMFTLAADGLVRRVHRTSQTSPVWRLVTIDPAGGVARTERELKVLRDLDRDLQDVRASTLPPRREPTEPAAARMRTITPPRPASTPLGPTRNGRSLDDRVLTYLTQHGPATKRHVAMSLVENLGEVTVAITRLHAHGRVRLDGDDYMATEAA